MYAWYDARQSHYWDLWRYSRHWVLGLCHPLVLQVNTWGIMHPSHIHCGEEIKMGPRPSNGGCNLPAARDDGHITCQCRHSSMLPGQMRFHIIFICSARTINAVLPYARSLGSARTANAVRPYARPLGSACATNAVRSYARPLGSARIANAVHPIR